METIELGSKTKLHYIWQIQPVGLVDIKTVKENIRLGLKKEGFTEDEDYVIMIVPNIVDIGYGRGVGYTFTEHDLGKEVHSISATKIREQMREEGKLAKKH